jgi:hypothetical protein
MDFSVPACLDAATILREEKLRWLARLFGLTIRCGSGTTA